MLHVEESRLVFNELKVNFIETLLNLMETNLFAMSTAWDMEIKLLMEV